MSEKASKKPDFVRDGAGGRGTWGLYTEGCA